MASLYAVNYFLTRTNKQVAHFNRKSVSYAPAPRQTSLRVGPTSNLIDDTGGSGGSCTYDDEGGMDCSGGGAVGGGGNEGGGYEGGEGGEGGEGSDYDYGYAPFPDPAPNEPTGGCEGNCEYPTGNNNGAPDPCIDPNGNRICSDPSQIPQVPITGQFPPAPACDTQPDGSIVCGMQAAGTIPGMPPVWIPPAPITNWNAPIFPQSWCNNVHVLCSRGQEPGDTNSAPPVPDDYVGVQGEQSGTSVSGNRHTSGPLAPENGGTGDAQMDFDKLTGGTGKKFPEGDSRANQPGVLIGDNGIWIRPGSKNPDDGPRIEIPGKGNKLPETLHY